MSSVLEDIIKDEIRSGGPMSVERYMSLCMGHERHGYYMKQDPLGEAGDFLTAPEISQIFGELIGAWVADQWMQSGSPNEFILCECGPGRGSLMDDALRATKHVEGFHDAANLHLVETSPVLRQAQCKMLQDWGEPQWHDAFEAVPSNAPLFLVANEFLDALPVRQLRRKGAVIQERAIDVNDDGALSFVFVDCDNLNYPFVEEGEIYEVSSIQEQFIQSLCQRLKTQGGRAIVIDYGYMKTAAGDTLQALQKHTYVDVLHSPGDCDLTTHVNFQRIGEIANEYGVSASEVVGQGEFLQSLGIGLRAEMLKKHATSKQADDLDKAVKRLVAPDEMGALFKVIILQGTV